MSLPSREIFKLVATYRAGFTVVVHGKKKTFIARTDNLVAVKQSQEAAEQLLHNFDPLIKEYFRFIRTGIPSHNTKNLAKFLNPEFLRLSMTHLEDDDIIQGLRLCLLSFCLKWDGIVQKFHWEVSNWINRETSDILTRRAPLTRNTQLHDPDNGVFQQIEEDFTYDVNDHLEVEEYCHEIKKYLPQHGTWNTIFTEEECRFIDSLIHRTIETHFPSVVAQNRLVESIREKIRKIRDSDQATITDFELPPLF